MATLWTPTQLGTDISRWFDAYNLTQSGGFASALTDLSPNGGTGANATQGTGSLQPAYSATGWDGTRPAITFDGVDDYLQFNFPAQLTTPFAFFIVMKNYSSGSGTGNNDLWRSTVPDAQASYRLSGGTTWTIFGAGGGFLDDATAYTGNTATVRLDFIDPSVGYISNGTYTSSKNNNTGNGGSATLSTTLGAMAGFSSYSAITMGEVLWLINATQAKVDLIMGYLHWRWNLQSRLPSSHPYFQGAPQLDLPPLMMPPLARHNNVLLRL